MLFSGTIPANNYILFLKQNPGFMLCKIEIEIPFGQSKDELSTRNIYCASISIDAFLSIKDLDFQWK